MILAGIIFSLGGWYYRRYLRGWPDRQRRFKDKAAMWSSKGGAAQIIALLYACRGSRFNGWYLRLVGWLVTITGALMIIYGLLISAGVAPEPQW